MGVSLETLWEVEALSKGMILEGECKVFCLMFCIDVDVPSEILVVSCHSELDEFLTFCYHFLVRGPFPLY